MISMRNNAGREMNGRGPMSQPAMRGESATALYSRVEHLEALCRAFEAKCEDALSRARKLQSRVTELEDLLGVTTKAGRRDRLRALAAEVVRIGAAEMGVSVAGITGESQARPMARARWVCQLFMREELQMSLQEIASATGRADHTTIRHALTRARALMLERGDFAEHYEALSDAWRIVDIGALTDGR